ncbi:tryptophan synthase beta subunit-like PLP-dependent enzyme [Xylariaceae sp. FL0594]|nr:tryptophan synthase beta subunit-like PLP-dependent enzyme [Xylariaceae sp. FL0594]
MAEHHTCAPLTRASVFGARELIRPFVHHTPTLTNATLDRLASTPICERDPSVNPRYESEGGSEGKEEKKKSANPKIRLYFKCENLQRVGAFKVRGAFHAIEKLKREPGWEAGGGRERGVATHSSGNHAQALALAARENGIAAHIVMPSIAPAAKIAATEGYGAEVTFSGSTSVEREAMVMKVIERTGARLVPPYDHPDIILGQGTLGLELQEDAAEIIASYFEQQEEEEETASSTPTATSGGGDTHHHTTHHLHPGNRVGKKAAAAQQAAEISFRAPKTKSSSRSFPAESKRSKEKQKHHPRLDAILTPCGGGGMLSGVALSCEGTGIRVYGCEPSYQGADDGRRGFYSDNHERVESVSSLTIADGLRTPIGRIPWSVIRGGGNNNRKNLVEGFYAVTEEEIVAALRLLYERFKLVVEPSGAVPLAVVLFNEEFRAMVEREGGEDGWDVGLVISGGNIGLEALAKLFGSP